MAKREGVQEPEINPDGSIPFIPLPSHHDPDLDNLTYGDPWGRLYSFSRGDIAWFIESGTVSKADWGYYLMAYFVIEDMYAKKGGIWSKPVHSSHLQRIAKNAHEKRGDDDYAIILGSKESDNLLKNPLRISVGQDPHDHIKRILGLPVAKRATGYWFKKWFYGEPTKNLLRQLSASIQK